MKYVGLIKEGKIPQDTRVALTPAQCNAIQNKYTNVKIIVEPSPTRCFADREYAAAGITLSHDMHHCDILLGIKEVRVPDLIENKTYLFFSHTKKKQAHNKSLLQAILQKKITLIDYECMEHDDGQRIIGFGFFAGIVGAHNGLMAYGLRTGAFTLPRVYSFKDYRRLISTYFGLRLPTIKIAVTGSGRVATGVLEIMNLLDVKEVEPDEYLSRSFSYPVYVHLKGNNLYYRKKGGAYNRLDFHENPTHYASKFEPYLAQTDILINGTYWEEGIPALFTWEQMLRPTFKLKTIADISNDKGGGIPCNLGDSTIAYPVYGVDPISRQVTDPYHKDVIDVMAISNLPNELPRDASQYFGDQLLKYIIPDLLGGGSAIINQATIANKGVITAPYTYMHDWVNEQQ